MDDAEAVILSPDVALFAAEALLAEVSGSAEALLIASDGFDGELTVRSGMLGAFEAGVASP